MKVVLEKVLALALVFVLVKLVKLVLVLVLVLEMISNDSVIMWLFAWLIESTTS